MTITIIKYERQGDLVTPLAVRREYDASSGRWWVDRVTVVPFPEPDRDAMAECPVPPGDHEAAPQFNTRGSLLLAAPVQSVSGTVQPVLQPASHAPMMDDYLDLDSKAWDVHSADHARLGNTVVDVVQWNIWVRDLFPGEASEVEEAA